MPSIVLYVLQCPAANCKAFSFLIMIHNFKGIMSSNHLLESVSCYPSCLLTGILNYHVGFHFTTFVTIFNIKSYEFLQRIKAYVVLVIEKIFSSLLLTGPVQIN